MYQWKWHRWTNILLTQSKLGYKLLLIFGLLALGWSNFQKAGLQRWLRGKRTSCSLRGSRLFPAHTWQLLAVCNSSSKGTSPSTAICGYCVHMVYTHASKSQTHLKKKIWKTYENMLDLVWLWSSSQSHCDFFFLLSRVPWTFWSYCSENYVFLNIKNCK